MKTLILVRHAKSCWDFPVPDWQRPLTQQGEQRAEHRAKELKQYIVKPLDAWITSSAKRTVDTSAIFHAVVQPSVEVIVSRDYYCFLYDELYDNIKDLEEQWNQVLIVGHNEAITDFINRHTDQKIDNLPTAGVAILQFESDVSWKTLDSEAKAKILC